MLAKPGLFKRDAASPAAHPASTPNTTTQNTSTPLGALKTATSVHAQSAESTSVPQAMLAATERKGDLAAAETSGSQTASRLIVGPEVKLKGAEILDCDTLVVEGRVEATMDSRVIQIAVDGAFSGKVGIDVAEIHGHFDGELTARSQLIIHATGRVSGKIRYGKILIEEGGELSGDVAALSAEPARASRTPLVANRNAAAS